jgi:glutamyl-tRNA reductase
MVELFKIGPEESINLRESFLRDLRKEHKQPGVLVQTCNRVEWYHGNGVINENIVLHLFRVISGLESSIIGETAIVNQVKTAYHGTAQKLRLDKSLHKLFQTAFFVGKRVRRETGISEGAMSHSQAVVNILHKKIPNLKGATITLIGVNKLNEKIIQFLLNKGASTIFIGNRTYEKARELANKYNSTALFFNNLASTLLKTDVLISATSAPHYIVKKESIFSSKPILIFDMALPRDVHPSIGDQPNVTLFNIDRIEKQLQRNVKVRHEKIRWAEEIIRKEVQIFLTKQSNGESGKWRTGS